MIAVSGVVLVCAVVVSLAVISAVIVACCVIVGADIERTIDPPPLRRPYALADADAVMWQQVRRIHAAEQAALDTLAQAAEMDDAS